jgi:hypothetical protein
LALASLTGGDRSIGIVRLRTKTTEFSFLIQDVKTALPYSDKSSEDGTVLPVIVMSIMIALGICCR